MKRAIYWLLDLLYPGRCVICRSFLDKNQTDLCHGCREKLDKQSLKVRKAEFFTLCVSPFSYEDLVRESLLRYKFGGQQYYCHAYGRLLAPVIRRELSDAYDYISWVPIHQKRRYKRGYDQAKLLAKAVGRELRQPVLPVLKKRRNTKAQSGIIGAEARKANINGAYSMKRNTDVAGKRILLIDDIYTTGATLSECSRMLRMAGAQDVVCATFAATPQKR